MSTGANMARCAAATPHCSLPLLTCRRRRLPRRQLYNFTTTTVTELLKQAKAPRVLDYVSIDVEGAEVLVLQGFDFGHYCIRAMNIEHNNHEPLRSNLRTMLEQHGLVFAGQASVDDYYLDGQGCDPKATSKKPSWEA